VHPRSSSYRYRWLSQFAAAFDFSGTYLLYWLTDTYGHTFEVRRGWSSHPQFFTLPPVHKTYSMYSVRASPYTSIYFGVNYTGWCGNDCNVHAF
jgi:hypothetical protein